MINIVKKIYIITGANGFLGNNIIRKLEQDADNEIRAFVLKGDSIKSLEGLIPDVKRDRNNYRIFDEKNIGWIKSLSCLKKCGMSNKEIK